MLELELDPPIAIESDRVVLTTARGDHRNPRAVLLASPEVGLQPRASTHSYRSRATRRVHLAVQDLHDTSQFSRDLVGDKHHPDFAGARVAAGAPPRTPRRRRRCPQSRDYRNGVQAVALAVASEELTQLL